MPDTIIRQIQRVSRLPEAHNQQWIQHSNDANYSHFAWSTQECQKIQERFFGLQILPLPNLREFTEDAVPSSDVELALLRYFQKGCMIHYFD